MELDLAKLLVSVDWAGLVLPTVSIVEKLLRTLLVFGFLVVGLRLAGKREVAQLNPFDFIVLLVLSNTLQNAVIGNDNSVAGGFVGAAGLLAINWGLNRFLVSHPRWEAALVGRKRMLVVRGKVDRTALGQENMTEGELELAAHKQGIPGLSEVVSAELDPDGDLFFVARTHPSEAARQKEILSRLDALTKEVAALRTQVAAWHGPTGPGVSALGE